MFHLLRRLIASQPQRLADHARAYPGLVGDELGRSKTLWKQRVLLSTIAIGLAGVAVVFGGAALMPWATGLAASIQEPWLLFAAPAVPAILAVWCAAEGRRENVDLFADLEQQIAADLVMLREVSGA